MKIIFKLVFLVAVVYVSRFVFLSSASAELIEPTHNFGEQAETTSRLTILSEPPGLKVSLDGKGLGKTPAFMLEVNPGIHELRIKDSETEIYLEPGKTLKISLFKNEFIQIPVGVKTSEQPPELEQQKEVSAPEPIKPTPEEVRTQENRDRAKDRWMRFVDGSSPSF